MLNLKLFVIVLLASSQSVHSAEADWEVLNLALDNINAANPSVLANSILNIVSGFLPESASIPTTATLPTVTTKPNTQPPPQVLFDLDSVTPRPRPSMQSADPASSMAQLFLLNPELFKFMVQSVKPQAPSAPLAPEQPIIGQVLPPKPNCECECKKKPKSLAEFLVNVPCPTTTEKPPKKIVVKVPCPTTTTTTEKPCACQCCPCNPCPSKPNKPKKAKKNEKECDDESNSHSEESKEVYKAYAHVPRKPNSVKNYFKYAHDDCSSEESH